MYHHTILKRGLWIGLLLTLVASLTGQTDEELLNYFGTPEERKTIDIKVQSNTAWCQIARAYPIDLAIKEPRLYQALENLKQNIKFNTANKNGFCDLAYQDYLTRLDAGMAYSPYRYLEYYSWSLKSNRIVIIDRWTLVNEGDRHDRYGYVNYRFDRSSAKLSAIELEDLFANFPRALSLIASFVKKDLEPQKIERNPGIRKDDESYLQFQEGTNPEADNYSQFYFINDAVESNKASHIKFIFHSGDLGYFEESNYGSAVPVTVFYDYLKPEWQALFKK